MPLLRMWVHCPRASNGLLPRRSNLVGYVRWDARSDRFPPCQTIIPTAFRSQSGLPTIRPESRWQLATGPNGSALKNLAGALHTERLKCTFSVGRETKAEIPPLCMAFPRPAYYGSLHGSIESASTKGVCLELFAQALPA